MKHKRYSRENITKHNFLRAKDTNQRLSSLRVQTHNNYTLPPPKPPTIFNELYACNPHTSIDELWHIAHEYPKLRHWIVANPNATPELLEFLAQTYHTQVHNALEILCTSIDALENQT